VSDKEYAEFARELNHRWKMLCRKMSPEVGSHPDKYSLLYLPHPVIVPGGRFREVRTFEL
jgi:alpha,alpha-trehalase